MVSIRGTMLRIVLQRLRREFDPPAPQAHAFGAKEEGDGVLRQPTARLRKPAYCRARHDADFRNHPRKVITRLSALKKTTQTHQDRKIFPTSSLSGTYIDTYTYT
eukprot:1115153-Prorocentrum_minimum.AAC.2